MLKALLLLPLLGAALVALLPNRSFDLMRHLASAVAGATVLCAGLLLTNFDATTADIQFFETRHGIRASARIWRSGSTASRCR
jgi:NADH:ubiquinone oxidoreductase subunit 4 (subunit M)